MGHGEGGRGEACTGAWLIRSQVPFSASRLVGRREKPVPGLGSAPREPGAELYSPTQSPSQPLVWLRGVCLPALVGSAKPCCGFCPSPPCPQSAERLRREHGKGTQGLLLALQGWSQTWVQASPSFQPAWRLRRGCGFWVPALGAETRPSAGFLTTFCPQPASRLRRGHDTQLLDLVGRAKPPLQTPLLPQAGSTWMRISSSTWLRGWCFPTTPSTTQNNIALTREQKGRADSACWSRKHSLGLQIIMGCWGIVS